MPRVCAILLLCFAALAARAGDKRSPVPEAVERVPLVDFGMRGRPTRYVLENGRAYCTLNYVDATRLLLTFSLQRALPRHEEGVAHADHALRAIVYNLASGKVEADREFTLHDRANYLWPLGDGRFLLRSGGGFYVLDSSLEVTLLAKSDSSVRWVQTDPAANLMVMEIEKELHTAEEHARLEHEELLHDAPPPHEEEDAVGFRIVPLREQVFALRIPTVGPMAATDTFWLRAEAAGLTTSGVLKGVSEYEIWMQPWTKDGGEAKKVAKVASECRPGLKTAGAEQVLAVACMGQEQRIYGFSLKSDKDGHFQAREQWKLSEPDRVKLEALQPSSTVRLAVVSMLEPFPEEEKSVASGRLQVVDLETGKARMELPMRAYYGLGHAADISPDGHTLAVLRDGELEIFPIPPAAAMPAK